MGAAFLILVLSYIAHILWERHLHVDTRRKRKELPPEIKQQLEELKDLKEKYTKLGAFLFAVFLGFGIFYGIKVDAQQIELSPPITTIVSETISNEELFYVGGKTELPQSEVVVYFQNLQSGATVSQTTLSDKNGDWFYSHPEFLTSGSYLAWTQVRRGEQISPPSPQIEIRVSPTALQLGTSRLSFEALYLVISLILFFVIAALALVGIYHHRSHKKKSLHMKEEFRKAEESIKRGFALLHRDIQAELDLVHKVKFNRALTEEEHRREDAILRDLLRVKQIVGKELWEIEQEFE